MMATNNVKSHKCSECVQLFHTSGEMLQHMRDLHTTFVENAQMKIDRSQESSLQAKTLIRSTAAKCPFCKVDCQTRKKLMKHLDYDHQDEEAEVEPELKIIRLEKVSKEKLFGTLHKEGGNEAAVQAKKINIVNNLLISALESTDGKSEVSLSGTSETIKVSTTSIKFVEKKYKCFWCVATFRKRGKLMDHIDIFHKANKQQTEVEAEMIHVSGSATQSGTSVAESLVKKSFSVPPQEKKVPPPPAMSRVQPSKSSGKRKQSLSKQTSNASQDTIKRPEIPIHCNNVCKFTLYSSITEVSRPRQYINVKDSSGSCTFFQRKEDNPLPPIVYDQMESITDPPTIPTPIILPPSPMLLAPLAPTHPVLAPVPPPSAIPQPAQLQTALPPPVLPQLGPSQTALPPPTIPQPALPPPTLPQPTVPSPTLPQQPSLIQTALSQPALMQTALSQPTSPQYTNMQVQVSDTAIHYHPTAAYMDPRYRRYSASELGTVASPMSPPMIRLARPQPRHPIMNSSYSRYRQPLSLHHTPQQHYVNQQRHQMRMMGYQQRNAVSSLPACSYYLPSPPHDPNSPLDLRLSKF